MVTLSSEDLGRERNAVFDLLDALTCSGALSIDNASLHIVLAATHNFSNTVMNTIVHRNMNPIESMERSSLIMVRTLFRSTPSTALVQPSQLSRLRETAGALMAIKDAQEEEADD